MDSKILSIKNASGKTFSLLNESNNTNNSGIMKNTAFKVNKLTSSLNKIPAPKRKYHCTDSGCNKSFTTSGHLARHNRIHTGEKNFHCLHPGCPSRFSRQDNMMQHYRTHLSQKLKRQHMRQQQQQQQRDLPPQLHHHSYYGNEDILLFQPLVQTNKINRSRRSMTMPSMPYPPPITASAANTKVVNRPRRALSTCSDVSSTSSSSFSSSLLHSPPTHHYSSGYVPEHHHHLYQHHAQYHSHHHPSFQPYKSQQAQKQDTHDWTPVNSQKSLSGLLHLANIVSTFG